MAVNEKATKQAKVLDGLHLGLPDFWYPILSSPELGDRPVCVRRFGRDLALWRDANGRPRVLDNHCPHRGAPLSEGVVHGEELACSYHGWRFDGLGQCTRMPLEPEDSRRAERIRIASYPAEDRGGYVWMFYGTHDDATPLTIPDELADDDWLPFTADYQWRTSWLNILDNIMDPLHAIYLHSGAATQKNRAKFQKFEVTHDDARGFRLGKIGRRADGSIGAVEGEVEFVLPNLIRLDIADGTPDGLYRVAIMPTPIDETASCAFYIRARRGRGAKRLGWRLWWARYHRAVHRVAAQDERILSKIAPIGESRLGEHLVSSDVGVIHLRKRLNRSFYGAGEHEELPARE